MSVGYTGGGDIRSAGGTSLRATLTFSGFPGCASEVMHLRTVWDTMASGTDAATGQRALSTDRSEKSPSSYQGAGGQIVDGQVHLRVPDTK